MGEIADMMLDGILDCETGEYIDGEAPGYPRTLERSAWPNRQPQWPRGKLRSRSGASFVEVDRRRCPTCQRSFRGEQGLTAHRKAKEH